MVDTHPFYCAVCKNFACLSIKVCQLCDNRLLPAAVAVAIQVLSSFQARATCNALHTRYLSYFANESNEIVKIPFSVQLALSSWLKAAWIMYYQRHGKESFRQREFLLAFRGRERRYAAGLFIYCRTRRFSLFSTYFVGGEGETTPRPGWGLFMALFPLWTGWSGNADAV